MLDWLYEFLGSMLYGFSSLFGGKYVFGLLIYALIFKILFLPFSVKQQKNQIKMAALAPQNRTYQSKIQRKNRSAHSAEAAAGDHGASAKGRLQPLLGLSPLASSVAHYYVPL